MGVAVDPRPDIDELVVAVAAFDLATGTELPRTPLDDATWRRFLLATARTRLAGLLAAAIADGAFAASGEQQREADQWHTVAMRVCLELEALLVRLVDELDGAGIDHRILKGSAAAHLDYRDPERRSFGDLDILVRGDQLDQLYALLAASGSSRGHPQPRPGFDRRFSKGAAFRTSTGFEIDVHRTLAMGPFGFTVDLDDLWSRSEPFELAGRPMQALAREERFLHACFHAALGDAPPRPLALRDVAQIALHPAGVDTARILWMAGRWRAEPVLARGVSLAWRSLRLEPTELSEWAERRPLSRRERRALATYTDRSVGYAARSLAAVRVIPGLRAKAAFVRALAFPDRSYTAGRHSSRLVRWRKGAREGWRAWRAP